MPSYTRKQILNHHNPYELFAKGDSLAEHKEILDNLSNKEKNDLAIKIISNCPQEKFANYFLQLKAIAYDIPQEDTFYEVIERIYQVKKHILDLMDTRNKNLHQLFEDSIDHFNEYNEFALSLLKRNELNLAERMISYAPDNNRAKLTRQIHSVFPKSTLAQQVSIMCSLHHQLTLLLSDNPADFFNKELDGYVSLSILPSSVLAGKEKEIGLKLAEKTSEEKRAKIIRQLNLMTASAHSAESPFAIIAETFKGTKISTGKNHFTTFGKQQEDPESNAAHSQPATFQS
jgi:hypothetical protein